MVTEYSTHYISLLKDEAILTETRVTKLKIHTNTFSDASTDPDDTLQGMPVLENNQDRDHSNSGTSGSSITKHQFQLSRKKDKKYKKCRRGILMGESLRIWRRGRMGDSGCH